jgi:ABC-2 type transport system permease protein
VAGLLIKDLKVLTRDTTQWSQLLILLALIVIYLFNLYKLPVEIVQDLRQIIFFLNIGFVGFIIAAVASRLVFPAVSLEGRSFWMLRSAPITVRTLLWEKFLAGSGPLVILSMILISFSIYFLRVDGFMSLVALSTVFLLTVGISALATGLGAVFSDFRIDNPEEAVTSSGGVIYMLAAVFYITLVLIIEATPVYAHYFGRLVRMMPFNVWWSYGLPVLMLVVVHGSACTLPFVFGARALERK